MLPQAKALRAKVLIVPNISASGDTRARGAT
jgi:hypothetical protein